jgi:hypothetical protein
MIIRFFCHSTTELHNFLSMDKRVIVGLLEPLHGRLCLETCGYTMNNSLCAYGPCTIHGNLHALTSYLVHWHFKGLTLNSHNNMGCCQLGYPPLYSQLNCCNIPSLECYSSTGVWDRTRDCDAARNSSKNSSFMRIFFLQIYPRVCSDSGMGFQMTSEYQVFWRSFA